MRNKLFKRLTFVAVLAAIISLLIPSMALAWDHDPLDDPRDLSNTGTPFYSSGYVRVNGETLADISGSTMDYIECQVQLWYKEGGFWYWLANSDYVENTNQYFASGQAKHTDTKDYYAGQTYHFYWDYNYGYDSWYSVGEYGAEI